MTHHHKPPEKPQGQSAAAWAFLACLCMVAFALYAIWTHTHPLIQKVEVEKIVTKYVDKIVEVKSEPITVTVEKEVEKIVEKPIILTEYKDKIVEKVVNVPVEKIVYRDRPAPEAVTVIEYVPAHRWRR